MILPNPQSRSRTCLLVKQLANAWRWPDKWEAERRRCRPVQRLGESVTGVTMRRWKGSPTPRNIGLRLEQLLRLNERPDPHRVFGSGGVVDDHAEIRPPIDGEG